ncbi:MAG: Ig-like domain-containing protein [Bacteroidota bacterium]|nr:Ig-like domain-containing protein [Bacteroidota bacterium]
MKQINSSGKIILFWIPLLLFINCARVASPPGGPKDETPPEIQKSSPQNYSVNFTDKVIDISFDEYIRFDNINQLIVSPPMKTKPDIKMKGKGIQIKMDDTLTKNTTYTLNFGNSIVDNNESNPIENFQFVFSTGPNLDSLNLSGVVMNAYDLEVPKDVYILLYDNLADSAIYIEKPLYLTKANEKGNFFLSNLKVGKFNVFALQDEDQNYIYNPPENIAFLDTILVLRPETHGDSVIISDSIQISSPKYKLKLFEEKLPNQYIISTTRHRKDNILLVFNEALSEKPMFSLPGRPDLTNWYIEESFTVGDSIGIWLNDTSLINQESIDLSIKFPLSGADKGKYLTDTTSFRFTKPKSKSRKTSKPAVQAESKLILTFSLGAGNRMELNRNLLCLSQTPINSYDENRIAIFAIKDSIETEVDFKLIFSRTRIRNIYFNIDWKEDTDYRIELLPDAITDMYHTINDSLKYSFKTRKLDYYGTLEFEMEEINENIIIQLLDEKQQVVKSTLISNDTTLTYQFLPPKTYRIKAILDENKNGKWDTGSWLKKQQPEKVKYYFEEIKLRSNWEFKKTWSPDF